MDKESKMAKDTKCRDSTKGLLCALHFLCERENFSVLSYYIL